MHDSGINKLTSEGFIFKCDGGYELCANRLSVVDFDRRTSQVLLSVDPQRRVEVVRDSDQRRPHVKRPLGRFGEPGESLAVVGELQPGGNVKVMFADMLGAAEKWEKKQEKIQNSPPGFFIAVAVVASVIAMITIIWSIAHAGPVNFSLDGMGIIAYALGPVIVGVIYAFFGGKGHDWKSDYYSSAASCGDDERKNASNEHDWKSDYYKPPAPREDVGQESFTFDVADLKDASLLRDLGVV